MRELNLDSLNNLLLLLRSVESNGVTPVAKNGGML